MPRFTARHHIAAVLSTFVISLALHGLGNVLWHESSAQAGTISHESDTLVLPPTLR